MGKENGMLFLDLEWNQYGKNMAGNEEIVAIGAVLVDGAEKSSFFSFVRPSQYVTRYTKKLIRANQLNLDKAPGLQKACRKLKIFAGEPSEIVIWSENAKVMYEEMCVAGGISFAAPVFVLQTRLSKGDFFGRCVSFAALVSQFTPEYDPSRAHNAGQDAECLCSLYEIVYECLKKGGIEASALYNTLEVDNSRKNRAKSIRGFKGKSVEGRELDEILNYFHLQSRDVFGCCEINTGVSRWHMYMKDGFVTALYHENYRNRRKKGFHPHKLKENDAFTVLEYISRHDAQNG